MESKHSVDRDRSTAYLECECLYRHAEEEEEEEEIQRRTSAFVNNPPALRSIALFSRTSSTQTAQSLKGDDS